MAWRRNEVDFEDHFPLMVKKLGSEGFMKELCNGFMLLMDRDKGVITFESLKRSAVLLGLDGTLSEDDIMCMLREGDLNGDGTLNKMEFFSLMFRLSPALFLLNCKRKSYLHNENN